MTAKLRVIRPLLLSIVCLIALSPTVAHASSTYAEKVAGIETAFVSGGCPGGFDASSFAGTAFGTLNGTFAATICHTPLDTTAQIVGGTFALNDGSHVVTGGFGDGLVQARPLVHVGTFCAQNFKVTGALTPAGAFSAVLTHYGLWDGTNCNVRFATVVGTATLIV